MVRSTMVGLPARLPRRDDDATTAENGMNASQDGWMARAALRSAAWAERWFPDAWVFAALGVVLVALAAFAFGATPLATVNAFGDGFWSLIPFTMQMAFEIGRAHV